MRLVRRALVVLCVVVGVLVVAADRARAATCAVPTFGTGAEYQPAKVDNQWFPLPVGTTSVYAGTKDAKAAVDVVTVIAR